VHVNIVLGLAAVGELVVDLDRPLDDDTVLMRGRNAK
jgi:hypothetical protein